MVIGTNVASLTAQRHLATSRADLEQSMERLSSGKRINSAMDDAAGLAIRDRMTSQVNGLNQAVRNAGDAISLGQTAEGALDESTSILQRMRELSVQSVNGTNTAKDREALQSEVTQLQTELTRIATSSKFNGKAVLDGTFTSQTFQIGQLGGDTVNLSINDMKSTALGDKASVSAVTAAKDKDTYAYSADTAASGKYEFVYGGTTYTQDFSSTATGTMDALLVKINAGESALTATKVDSKTFTLELNAASDTQMTKGSASGVGASSAALTGVTPVDSTVGKAAVTAAAAQLAVGSVDISTATGATSAIASIDSAIEEVGQERAKLGAFQNRLEHTVSNLQSMIENTGAAQSRIEDADFATESANLAKNQVLQQAGTAMLSQANASTQNVLSLLK
tara:strand:+ start:268 stop:1452 length:1185 start_codon:yes stop_codon:yes gene_type:complete